MSQMKIREINKYLKAQSKPLLFMDPALYTYPEILDDEGQPVEVNFIEDYEAASAAFDRYFVKKYGDRVVDFESEEVSDIVLEWLEEMFAITNIYIYNWARLYYALSLQYNPLYNVDGVEKQVYGIHESTFKEGDREHTEGEKEYTSGTQENYTTEYTVAYDSAQEKEDSRSVDNVGRKVDSEAEYTNTDTHALDTNISKEHTDILTRKGNIGVTKSTELLADTFKLYRDFAFWDVVFKTMIESIGAYWED